MMPGPERLYALLRFEEAALALRVVMRINLIKLMGDHEFSQASLGEELGFTWQGARTFFSLLNVMGILETREGSFRLTQLAKECLSEDLPTSRKPYLAMGSGENVEDLINILRGNPHKQSVPLYSHHDNDSSIMDDTAGAQEIAYGLAARARNFAEPLALGLAAVAPSCETLADIGAGSPYVVNACLQKIPTLQKSLVVDRCNAMTFVRAIMAREQIDTNKIALHETNFFSAVPQADIYILSNTAHDWQPRKYTKILKNIRNSISEGGVVCIHEPLLTTHYTSDSEWIHALWMACYALTLFKLTLGEGTCYTLSEHHAMLAEAGFLPHGKPISTSDGCSALFYKVHRT